MRTLFIGLAFLTTAATVRAEQPATSATVKPESFAAVKSELDAATKKASEQFSKEFEAARKAGKGQSFKFSGKFPGPEFSPRFLKIAENDPDGPDALNALLMAVRTSSGEASDHSLDIRERAFKILHARYITKPEIRKALRLLASIDTPESTAIVRDVAAKNPNREVQAAAYRALINIRETIIDRTEKLTKNKEMIKKFEEQLGKEKIAQMVTQTERFKKELPAIKKEAEEKCGDLLIDLSVGRTAPEVVTRDVDGKTVRLSETKGKVVVLDIWATWCGPCRAMIPHEREMVERLKGKPFELVSISVDENLDTLKKFLAKEKMPWTHWWVGVNSKFGDDWNIQHFPTIYVLDTKGVIRYKEIRGEKLERAVNALLVEAEPARAAAR
jgi:thiol-disulfide isomerase/thioredoxin